MRIYDATAPATDQFWTGRKLLTHDAQIYRADSIRNLGKSTVGRKQVMKAIMKGHNAVWSRWSSSELRIAESAIVDERDLRTAANPDGAWQRVRLNGVNMYYDEYIETHGRLYFMAVKAASSNRGIDIYHVDAWVYDEYIPEFYDNRTRKIEEASKFFSMYQSIVRLNKHMRVYMFANCITWFNSYNVAWGIKPFPSNQIRVYTQMMQIEMEDGTFEPFRVRIAYENVGVTDAMKRRVAANEAIRGAALPEGYFDNQTGDNVAFIERCPNRSAPVCASEWVLNGKTYTYRYYDDLLYWFESKPRKTAYRYTTNKDDVGKDVIRDRNFGPVFDDLYDKGRMRFETGHVQEAIITMIWEASKSTFRS